MEDCAGSSGLSQPRQAQQGSSAPHRRRRPASGFSRVKLSNSFQALASPPELHNAGPRAGSKIIDKFDECSARDSRQARDSRLVPAATGAAPLPGAALGRLRADINRRSDVGDGVELLGECARQADAAVAGRVARIVTARGARCRPGRCAASNGIGALSYFFERYIGVLSRTEKMPVGSWLLVLAARDRRHRHQRVAAIEIGELVGEADDHPLRRPRWPERRATDIGPASAPSDRTRRACRYAPARRHRSPPSWLRRFPARRRGVDGRRRTQIRTFPPARAQWLAASFSHLNFSVDFCRENASAPSWVPSESLFQPPAHPNLRAISAKFGDLRAQAIRSPPCASGASSEPCFSSAHSLP